MSQENVEVVRATFEAWNAGDMDAIREQYDPGVIAWAPEGWPEPGPFVGREAVMRPTFFRERIRGGGAECWRFTSAARADCSSTSCPKSR